MGDVAQKLTLIAELLGDKQVLEGLRKIVEEQGKVAGSTADAAKSQDDATLKLKDFTNVLGIIDPRLQSMVLRLFKAGEAFGDIGTKAIDFAGVGKGLLETLTKFGPALALLGAGAAVAAGIAAIGSAMAKMREDTEKATEAIKQQQDALNTLKSRQADVQRSVEGVSDARRRGGFDASTAALAEAKASRIKQLFPDLEGAAIAGAVGNLFDVTQDTEQLAQAAFLIQTDRLKFTGKESPGRAGAKLANAQRGGAAALQTYFSRERSQRGSGLVSGARGELRSIGGENVNLRELIGMMFPDLGEEATRKLIERAEATPTLSELEESIKQRRMYFPPADPRNDFRPYEPILLPEGEVITPDEARLRQLYKGMDQIERGGARTPGRPLSINIHHNSRFIHPFARGQELARTNGESRAKEMEFV